MPEILSRGPFQTTCPHCSKADGWPFRVTPRANSSVEIDLRCRACGHEWADEMSHGALLNAELPVVVRAKNDRRQTPR